MLPGLAAGSLLAGYRIESRIGAGGMAVVFKATEETLRRTVALKVLVPALGMDSEFRERFIHESRAATAVDHPHIIPVYAAGDAGGVLYIAMRYVPGGDLRALIRRKGKLPTIRTAYLLSPLASALDAGHAIGLVHRDVKPGNVLIDTSPRRIDHPYLSDFGLAKGTAYTDLTATGQFVGTVEYCAPEQIAGKAVGPAADQYGLACVAYTMLTGEVPFPREGRTAVMWAHMTDPPPSVTALRPDLPPAADQVLARGMAKTPEDRYPTCEQFVDTLRDALGIGGYGIPRRLSALVPVLESSSILPATKPDPPTPMPEPPLPVGPPLPGRQSLVATALPSTADQAFPDHAQYQPQPHLGGRYDGLTDSRAAAGQMVPPITGPMVTGRPLGGHRAKKTPRRRRTRAGVAVSAVVVAAVGGAGIAWLLRNHGYSMPLTAILSEPKGAAPLGVAFASNAGLVTADLNGAYSWNLERRQETRTVTAPRCGFYSVALSADGSTLAAASINSCFGRSASINSAFGIWSPSSGSRTYSSGSQADDPFAVANAMISSGFSSGALSSSGVLVYPGSTSTSVWDLLTGSMVNNLSSLEDALSVAVSPDGSTVATSDGRGLTELWNAAKSSNDPRVPSTPSAFLRSPDVAPVSCSGFSSNGRMLITGDIEGNAYVWDKATHAINVRPAATLSDPDGGALTAVALSPDGTLAATFDSANNAIYLWDVASRSLVAAVTDQNGKSVVGLSFSPNGRELAAADANGNTYVYRINP